MEFVSEKNTHMSWTKMAYARAWQKCTSLFSGPPTEQIKRRGSVAHWLTDDNCQLEKNEADGILSELHFCNAAVFFIVSNNFH